MILIRKRFIQLFIFMVIVGIGQHISVRAESSVGNQFQNTHFNKFDLAKYGLRIQSKESNRLDISKIKGIVEENEVESIEVETKKSLISLDFYFNLYKTIIPVEEIKLLPKYYSFQKFLNPLEICILHQVFRI